MHSESLIVCPQRVTSITRDTPAADAADTLHIGRTGLKCSDVPHRPAPFLHSLDSRLRRH